MGGLVWGKGGGGGGDRLSLGTRPVPLPPYLSPHFYTLGDISQDVTGLKLKIP